MTIPRKRRSRQQISGVGIIFIPDLWTFEKLPSTNVITIPDLLRMRAAEEPNRVALIVDGIGSMSYLEWDSRSNSVARGLAERNVAASDRIALYFDEADWLDFAVAYFGVLKLGAVAVPLSRRFVGSMLADTLDRCAAVGVVGNDIGQSTACWTAITAELEERQSTEPFSVMASDSDLAEVLYTSGTTGVPKGIGCTHAHVVRPLLGGGSWLTDWRSECTGGINLHSNAISTGGGQLRLFEALGPERMTMLALPVFDPERFCALVLEYQARAVHLIPSIAAAILSSGAAARSDLSGVKVVSSSCAPLPVSLISGVAEAFPRADLVNTYGVSEARYAHTSITYDGTRRLGSIGRPRGETEVIITDEAGCAVDKGIVGEVRIRWRGLALQHYFRDAEATRRVFIDSWTRTGDAGYLDPEGYLYLTDRIKDIIIKGGMNVSSLDVENALREHPTVADCAAFGVPDPVHGEEVAVAVVVRAGVSPSDLRSFLVGRVPPLQVPRYVLTLSSLPRNRSGKVLKTELRSRFGRQPGSGEDVPERS